MQRAIENSKNAAPGKEMINNTTDEVKQFLLRIMNHLFANALFSEQWKHTHVVPILKPDKNHSIVCNYRPIALTSTICKILERIVKVRLLEYIGEISALCSAEKKRRDRQLTT